jgi:disulfide bond formation protein DsbB
MPIAQKFRCHFPGRYAAPPALAHPEDVVPVDRSARAKRQQKRFLFAGSMAPYAMMLAIPVVILTLLMLFARLK